MKAVLPRVVVMAFAASGLTGGRSGWNRAGGASATRTDGHHLQADLPARRHELLMSE